jgi:hypothetical protein
LSYLDLRDLLRSARTCKTLYNNIVPEKGASVWRARGLGSHTTSCNIVHLTRWLRGKNKTYDLIQQLPKGFDYEPRMQKVLQAVFLAAPSEIIPYLDVLQEVKNARLFREKPVNDLTFKAAGKSTLKCLKNFGLPWKAVRHFLEKVIQERAQLPLSFQDDFIYILKRIAQDHPHFDLRTILDRDVVMGFYAFIENEEQGL